jgi:hypothetical protein
VRCFAAFLLTDDAAAKALIRDATAGLAATLTGLLTYPPVRRSNSFDEEELEDLQSLRDPRLGVSELLAGCCSILGGDFFSSCAALLSNSAALPQEDWRGVEVVLFLLSNSMSAIKELLGAGQVSYNPCVVSYWFLTLIPITFS